MPWVVLGYRLTPHYIIFTLMIWLVISVFVDIVTKIMKLPRESLTSNISVLMEYLMTKDIHNIHICFWVHKFTKMYFARFIFFKCPSNLKVYCQFPELLLIIGQAEKLFNGGDTDSLPHISQPRFFPSSSSSLPLQLVHHHQ